MAITKSKALTDLESVKRYLKVTSVTDDRLIDALTLQACVMVQKFLGCDIVKTEYTKEIHNSTGTTRLMLNNYPIIEVDRVAVGIDDVMSVEYDATDASHARIQVTKNTVKLRKTVSGVVTKNSLVFSDYITIDLMAAAISALTNWTGTATSSFGSYPSADLIQMPGTTANDTPAYLSVPSETETDIQIENAEYGVLYNPYGFGFNFNRTGAVTGREWGTMGGRFSQGVALIYIDYTAGYETIPEPIESAVWELVKIMWDSRKRDMSLVGETIGDYTWRASPGGMGDVLDPEDQKQSALILAKLTPYRRMVFD